MVFSLLPIVEIHAVPRRLTVLLLQQIQGINIPMTTQAPGCWRIVIPTALNGRACKLQLISQTQFNPYG